MTDRRGHMATIADLHFGRRILARRAAALGLTASAMTLTAAALPAQRATTATAEDAMTPTASPARFADRLTRDNAALLLIDHQVGLLTGIRDMAVTDLKRHVVGMAKAATILDVPVIVSTVMPDFWGPLLPELAEALPGLEIIERTTVNAWDEARVRNAIEATGRTKLIIAGLATEVCVAFSAIAATAAGYDVYAAVDASGNFEPTTPNTLRMLQAGVIVTNSGVVVIEMLNDNADPKTRDVYTALDMPFATLIGQLSGA